MQIVVAVIFAFFYKLLDIIVHIPFGIHLTFCVEDNGNEKTPEVASFLCNRLISLLEYMLLNLPMLILFCLAAKWTDSWFWLICLLTTGFFKCLIVWIYPVMIMPEISSLSQLSESSEARH